MARSVLSSSSQEASCLAPLALCLVAAAVLYSVAAAAVEPAKALNVGGGVFPCSGPLAFLSAPVPQAPARPRVTGAAGPLERWGWYEVRTRAPQDKHLGYFVRGKEVARKAMP